jgi:hypothetical protein
MPNRRTFPSCIPALLIGSFAIMLALGCDSSRDVPVSPDPAGGESAVAAPDTANGVVDALGSGQTENGTSADSEALYSPEAFRSAALEGKLRVVELCLEGGLAVDEPDPNGFTPLAMAAYNGHDDIVKLLIKKKAKVDSRDRLGNTPLIHAASGPYPTTVEILLDAGAEINAVDAGEHFTALMMAAAEGNIEVVKVLLAKGADKTLLDVDGESAADFARSKGHAKIAELLSAQ